MCRGEVVVAFRSDEAEVWAAELAVRLLPELHRHARRISRTAAAIAVVTEAHRVPLAVISDRHGRASSA